MNSLRDRVARLFANADTAADFMGDQLCRTDDAATQDAVQRFRVEFLAFGDAVKNALIEIAAEIDKLTAAQRND